MTKTITISLPVATIKKVRTCVKTGQYASTSEFFRTLLRKWEEDVILKQITENKKTGKSIKLTSFAQWE